VALRIEICPDDADLGRFTLAVSGGHLVIAGEAAAAGAGR
jgi:hypothetical protein